METKMKLTKLALACALTGALAACGGGSDKATGDGGSGATTRTLAGFAAKGLIKNGIVEVFSYDAAGKKSALPLVTTRTLTDGSYTLNLGSNTGLFTIEVRADANTTMADEVSNQDIPMPQNLTLRSLVQLDSAAGAAITGFVTPFTDMLVTAAANASGGLTSANIATAKSGVIAILGFDPLKTKPINVNSAAAAAATDPSEQLQSLALAALSRLANDGSLGCTEATLAEKIKCVVTATAGSASLQNGKLSLPNSNALAAALQKVTADTSINKTALKSLDGITIFPKDTVTVAPVVANPIAAAKALFASLRTNIQALSDAFNNGSAAQSVNVLKANFDAAIAPLDQDLADWVLISDKGVTLFNNYMNNGKVGASNTQLFSNGAPVGKCTLYSNAASTVEVTGGASANNVFCRLTKVTIAQSPFKQFTKTIKLTPTGTTGFGYTTRARLETDGVVATTGLDGTGTVSFAKTGNTTATLAINGDMPARTNSMGGAITDKETWNVNFARTLEADASTTKYAVSGDITAVKDGLAISAIALQDGSFIRAVGQTLQEVQLLLDIAGNGSKITGTLYLGQPSADKLGGNIIPTLVRFTGSFSNGGAEFFDGALTAQSFNYANYDGSAATTSANFVNASVSFTGSAKIPGHPDLALALRASQPAFNVAAFSGQYNDGSNIVLVNSTNATGTQIVNVLSTNGVAMRFVAGVNKVDVTKNDSIIASFNRATGLINYTDGSIESLK